MAHHHSEHHRHPHPHHHHHHGTNLSADHESPSAVKVNRSHEHRNHSHEHQQHQHQHHPPQPRRQDRQQSLKKNSHFKSSVTSSNSSRSSFSSSLASSSSDSSESSSNSSLSSSNSSKTSLSNSSVSSSFSSSASCSSWSSESSSETVPSKPNRAIQRHSQSCVDISRGRTAFEDEEDSMPLLDANGRLKKSTSKERKFAVEEKDRGSAKKEVPSQPQNEKRQQQNYSIRVPVKNIRKTKSMEVLSRRSEHASGERLDEKELEKRKREAHKNFVKEKMKFSAFLNEITRQVLSPSRLTSLGVTDVQRPSSPGHNSTKVVSPKAEQKAQKKSKSSRSRSSSVASTAQSHVSKHSHSSKHSCNHSHFKKHSHSSSSFSSQKNPVSTQAPSRQRHSIGRKDTGNDFKGFSSESERDHLNQKQQISASERHLIQQHSPNKCSPLHQHPNEDLCQPYGHSLNTEKHHQHSHVESQHHQSSSQDHCPHRCSLQSCQYPFHYEAHRSPSPSHRSTSPREHCSHSESRLCSSHSEHHHSPSQSPHGGRSQLSRHLPCSTDVFHPFSQQESEHDNSYYNYGEQACSSHLSAKSNQHYSHHECPGQHHDTHFTKSHQHHSMSESPNSHASVPGYHHHVRLSDKECNFSQHESLCDSHHGVAEHHSPLYHPKDCDQKGSTRCKSPHHHEKPNSHQKDQGTSHSNENSSPTVRHRHQNKPQPSEPQLHNFVSEGHGNPVASDLYNHPYSHSSSLQLNQSLESASSQHSESQKKCSESSQYHPDCNENPHTRDHRNNLCHSPVGHRSTSPQSEKSDSSTNSTIHDDQSTTSFPERSSVDKDAELEKLMRLKEQNEVLHHSLLQTTVRMECMGAEFKTGHQLLESELQRTRIELNSLMDKFTRLQDNYSCTQHTNHLLEKKLHCVAQNMDDERERLNHRISELTEQLSAAKTTIQGLETISVVQMLPESLVKNQQTVDSVAPPPAQFMDGELYNNVSMHGDEQALGTLPEEEESDWSEMGEEAQNASFSQCQKRHGCWDAPGHYGKGNMNIEGTSRCNDIGDTQSPHGLQIPNIKFTVHPETLPLPLEDASLARFKQSSDAPDNESYHVAETRNLGSSIRALSASLEEIHSIGMLKEQQDYHGHLRSNKSVMDLHQSQLGRRKASYGDEIICNWREANSLGAGEDLNVMVDLESAQKMLNHFIHDGESTHL